MKLLPHEIPIINMKMSKLKKLIDEKHILAVEAGEQSTENMMHDDAPQQIAVEEGRVIQAQYDALRKLLHEAEVASYPRKQMHKITLGHHIEYIQDGNPNTVDIVGYPIGVGLMQISPLSPLAHSLIGKKVGEHAHLGSKTLVITAVTPLY